MAPAEKALRHPCAKVVEEETGVTPLHHHRPGGAALSPACRRVRSTSPRRHGGSRHRQPRNAYDMGLLTAQELRSCGVDFNLAPVMDINCNPDNPVIGVRSLRRYAGACGRIRQPDGARPAGRRRLLLAQAFSRPWRYGGGFPTLACLHRPQL